MLKRKGAIGQRRAKFKLCLRTHLLLTFLFNIWVHKDDSSAGSRTWNENFELKRGTRCNILLESKLLITLIVHKIKFPRELYEGFELIFLGMKTFYR